MKNRVYRQNNSEKVASNQRKYQEANKDKLAKYKREYAQANPQKLIDYQRKYRQANLEKVRIYYNRREARKRSLPDNLTEQQWIDCLEYFNYCCAVCGSQLRDLFNTVEPHADHWIPLASPECTGTVAENMICLCSDCNLSKGAKLPDVWLREQYSPRKANEVLRRVQAYFEAVLRKIVG